MLDIHNCELTAHTEMEIVEKLRANSSLELLGSHYGRKDNRIIRMNNQVKKFALCALCVSTFLFFLFFFLIIFFPSQANKEREKQMKKETSNAMLLPETVPSNFRGHEMF